MNTIEPGHGPYGCRRTTDQAVHCRWQSLEINQRVALPSNRRSHQTFEEKMKTSYIEVTRLDPKRWALLNIPIGVFLCVIGIISALFACIDDFHPELLIAGTIGLPIVIIPSFYIFGLLQALLINFFIRMLGKGSVLETRACSKTHSGEFRAEPWQR